MSEARVIDLSRTDYAFVPDDAGDSGKGLTGSVSCWSLPKPDVGDYLILASEDRKRTARYRVTRVNRCPDVDPPTMYIADVAFDPRKASTSVKEPGPVRRVSPPPDLEIEWQQLLAAMLKEAGGRIEIPFDMLIDPPKGVLYTKRDDARRVYVLTLKETP